MRITSLVAACALGACAPAHAQNYETSIFDVWGPEILAEEFELVPFFEDELVEGFLVNGGPCEHYAELMVNSAAIGISQMSEPVPARHHETGVGGFLLLLSNDPEVGYGEGWHFTFSSEELCLVMLMQPSRVAN